ncbi:ATP-binding protein [Kribbella sp. C-35]|uniref:ATP-binding protein n=1 Tax=Kribbella sp. C-35 TaxID=2789276 RepID=UPI00397B8503
MLDADATSAVSQTPTPLPGFLAFRRLDLLLSCAVTAARQRYGPGAAADDYRGLYLTAEQVELSLARPPGEPIAGMADLGADLPSWREVATDSPRWSWLRDTYGLTDLELDVVLIALGPDVDLRYERLYGYLQDDVSARRPTVNLALDLLTVSPQQRIAALGRFGPEAPLIANGLLGIRTDERSADGPLIAHRIAVDPQIVSALIGQDGLDPRLASFCRTVPAMPDLDPSDAEELVTPLAALVAGALNRRPLRLSFSGPPGSGRQRTAKLVAARLGIPLLVVDLLGLVGESAEVPERLRLVFREAAMRGSLAYLENVDMPQAGTAQLAAALADFQGAVVLATRDHWVPTAADAPLGVLDVPFRLPGAARRRRLWDDALRAAGVRADDRDVAAVAQRFRLSAGQIEDAALSAATGAVLRACGDEPRAAGDEPWLRAPDLYAAGRRAGGRALEALARRIVPTRAWSDLVLPDHALGQLRELAARVEYRDEVMETWGFNAKLSTGKGNAALFAGPPGTGKTLAAEVIAAELGLDLFTIDLSSVVSKYIGETEKNLERVFIAAADTDAILFFDEADALFGKRSEIRDSHDRYANLEIAFLLQRMERYDGLAVLATNVRHHLDDAFVRRLQVVVEFPFPDVPERRRIWQACLPPEAPLAADVDVDLLARHRLCGGNIKNIVLAAAFLAAAEGTPIGMDQLFAATRREHEKMGKVATDPSP